MDKAKVSSIPEIQANKPGFTNCYAGLPFGRINNEQLLKLETFGLSEEEAEEVMVISFLS